MAKTCKVCNYGVFGGGYCMNHQYLREDREPTMPLQKTPIRNKSIRKTKEDTIYKHKRELYLREHPLCQAKVHFCTRLATEIHHIIGRGKHYLDDLKFLSVCRNCHEWIENHPEEAKALNLSQSRL